MRFVAPSMTPDTLAPTRKTVIGYPTPVDNGDFLQKLLTKPRRFLVTGFHKIEFNGRMVWSSGAL
jgi:hypothetical protein